MLLDAHCSATWLGLPPWGTTGQVLGLPRAFMTRVPLHRLYLLLKILSCIPTKIAETAVFIGWGEAHAFMDDSIAIRCI